MRRLIPLAFALSLSGPALAAKDETPASEGWMEMTTDDATTTSRCFRTLETPQCALDAYYACIIRVDKEICDASDNPFHILHMQKSSLFEFAKQRSNLSSHLLSRKYRISSTDSGSKTKGPTPPPYTDWSNTAPGDVILKVEISECWKLQGVKNCETKGYRWPVEYYLISKRESTRWRVVLSHRPK